METFDALQSRLNRRAYSDRPIPEPDLDKVLETGRRTPSARNRQPWDFVLVTDRTQLNGLAECWPGAGHIAGSAATIVIVTPTEEEKRMRELNQYDLGQATAAMMIAATDLGIASAHAAVADQDLAREILGFPEGYYAAYFIALGYPTSGELSKIQNLDRRPFEDVVHKGTW